MSGLNLTTTFRERENQQSSILLPCTSQFIPAITKPTNKMLHYCLVVGIRDKILSKKLEMDAVLSLEMAREKKTIRQIKAVEEEYNQQQGDRSKTNHMLSVKSQAACYVQSIGAAHDKTNKTRKPSKPLRNACAQSPKIFVTLILYSNTYSVYLFVDHPCH